MKSLFQQEMIKRGILTSGGFNLCYAHSDEDVRRTLAACGDALSVLARALAEDRVEATLEGPANQPVFRSASPPRSPLPPPAPAPRTRRPEPRLAARAVGLPQGAQPGGVLGS